MSSNNNRKITFEEFGDLLEQEWEQGNISNEVHEYIQAGLIPIHILRDKLRWVIEREGDGLRISVANDDQEDINYHLAA